MEPGLCTLRPTQWLTERENDGFDNAYLIPVRLQLDVTRQEQYICGGHVALVSCAYGTGSALAPEVHCKKQIESSASEKNQKTSRWPLLLLQGGLVVRGMLRHRGLSRRRFHASIHRLGKLA
jgi:hypothetical protein